MLNEKAAEAVFQQFKHVNPRLNRAAIRLLCSSYETAKQELCAILNSKLQEREFQEFKELFIEYHGYPPNISTNANHKEEWDFWQADRAESQEPTKVSLEECMKAAEDALIIQRNALPAITQAIIESLIKQGANIYVE